MRSHKFGAFKVWLVVGLLGLTLTGGGPMLALAGGPGEPGGKEGGQRGARADGKSDGPRAGPMWKENYTVEYPDSLPVSVAFSEDGKTLLTGDTNGEVMALTLPREEPTYRWKSKPEGS